jgi:hypothetical protein
MKGWSIMLCSIFLMENGQNWQSFGLSGIHGKCWSPWRQDSTKKSHFSAKSLAVNA